MKRVITYEQRKALLESVRYVDLVIPENNREQKKRMYMSIMLTHL